jgi:hypothetical protein
MVAPAGRATFPSICLEPAQSGCNKRLHQALPCVGGTSREFSVLERGNLPCFVVLGVCQGQCRRDRSLSRKRRAFC